MPNGLAMSGAWSRRLEYFLLLFIATVGLGLVLSTIFSGGFATTLGGIRISSRAVFRPVVIAVVALLIARHRFRDVEARLAKVKEAIDGHPVTVALFLGVLTVAVAIRIATFEASAADAYGYVSQAALWVQGHLVTYEPLAASAPWPEATWTFAPLGYRPGQSGATIVPSYPPGLPITMAAFMKVFGPSGAFYAVPILGGVAVVATFQLGKHFAGNACGLMSAMLLLTSPIFLFQLKEPMSDVPATAWWVVATMLVAVPTRMAALGAGLATAAAVLTRPNLVPLAALLAGFALIGPDSPFRSRLQHVLVFAATAALGCVGVGLFNDAMYGSPLTSGYGSLTALFKKEHLWANLANYPRWLVESETPFICLAAIAPWLYATSTLRKRVWLYLGMFGVVFALYLFYVPFDNWTFVRFLLPVIPLLLTLSSAVALSLSFRLIRSSALKSMLIGLFCVLLAWRWDTSGVRPIEPGQRRFAVIGHFVRDQLPENAVVFAMIHSGSVRFYSGRATLRWDWLAREWLDRAVTVLRANGYRPYLLIEDWERAQFTRTFSEYSDLASLKWTPLATYRGGVRADIFELHSDGSAQRDRVATKTIEPPVD